MASHPRLDLHLRKRWGRRDELNSYLMLWILPQFFSRKKNVVYPYLGKKGCDENDEAKGSGKVLDPDSPSALAALYHGHWAGQGCGCCLCSRWRVGSVTKAFRRN